MPHEVRCEIRSIVPIPLRIARAEILVREDEHGRDDEQQQDECAKIARGHPGEVDEWATATAQ